MADASQPPKRRRVVPQLYRRPLPDACVAFNSHEGRARFQRALLAGTLEPYFSLSEQFRTQDEPAYCGLSTLVMVLNTLHIDPGKVWKGPWRWYHEAMLDCCKSLEKVQRDGITLDEFVCVAKCNGVNAAMTRAVADPANLAAFRAAVERCCTTPQVDEERMPAEMAQAQAQAEGNEEGNAEAGNLTGTGEEGKGGSDNESGTEVIALSYSRRPLGQTGDGHFTPLAGFDRDTDSVLLLDVARYKYPPHVSVDTSSHVARACVCVCVCNVVIYGEYGVWYSVVCSICALRCMRRVCTVSTVCTVCTVCTV